MTTTTYSGIKISSLPAAESASATDQIETNQAGTTRRITLEQVTALVAGSETITDAIEDAVAATPAPPPSTPGDIALWPFVELAGDTMTGLLTLQDGLSSATDIGSTSMLAHRFDLAMTGDGSTDSSNIASTLTVGPGGNVSLSRGIHSSIDVLQAPGQSTGFGLGFDNYVRLGIAGSTTGNLTAAVCFRGHPANESGNAGQIHTTYTFAALGVDMGDDLNLVTPGLCNGTVRNSIGVHIGDYGHASRILDTAIGVEVNDFTGGAPLTAAYTSAMTSGTNKWSFYFDGTARSYHQGGLTIGYPGGGTTEKLALSQTSAGGTANLLRLQNPSGTANTAVAISLDPGGNGFAVRDAVISATNNGGNVITLDFKLANGGDPASVFTIAPSVITAKQPMTLTGALTGTTATFSGTVATGQLNVGGTTPIIAMVDADGANKFLLNDNGTFIVRNNAFNTDLLAITDAGATTFSGTVFAPGAQIQMVSTQTGAMATGTALIPFDDTIPQIGEGTEFMTLVITPKSATSKLIIEVACMLSNSAVGTCNIAALFQDSTADALAAWTMDAANANYRTPLVFSHTMTSGSTSARTYRVRAGANIAGTTVFNGTGTGARMMGGAYASSIIIREVAT